jgi:drug/metabolite transporter (DMT)-like permease
VQANGGEGRSFARGVGWSLLAAAFAAGFLIPYRLAVESAPRLSAMTAMFVVAAMFNASVAAAQVGRRLLEVDRIAARTAVALALCTIAGNAAIAFALPDIGAGMTSAVMKAQVILTPLLAARFLGESASRRLWVGAVLALAGFVVPQVAQAGGLRGSAGYALAFGAAVAFAAMQIVTRRVIHDIQPASVNTLRLLMAVGALQLVPEGRAAWRLTPEIWLYAGLAGVLGPGLSRLSLMAALGHISPSITALVALVGPVLAFGLGYAFFGEAPTSLEVAGAALILFGVLWPLIPGLRRPARR